MTYKFTAKSTRTKISFESTTKGKQGPVIANVSVSTPVDPPNALETIPVPTPPDLEKYVANRDSAVSVLGKALFWDMQTGGDGKTACATCHWHAGADAANLKYPASWCMGSASGHQTAVGPVWLQMLWPIFQEPTST